MVENGTTDQKDSSTVYRMLPLPLTKTICIKSNQEKMITAVIIFKNNGSDIIIFLS